MKMYKKAMLIAEEYDVSTPKDSLVLFSISKLPTDINKRKAFAYVEKNPDKKMIDHTPCGQKLEAMDLFSEKAGLSYEEASNPWYVASRRLIEAASGNVTAFVDKAHPEATFRKIELAAILGNEKITTINKKNKWKYKHLVTDNHKWFEGKEPENKVALIANILKVKTK
jgi:hypothetical protein